MKKLFFLFILLPFFSTAQSDTTFSPNTAVISVNEKGIDALVSKYKHILKAKNGVDGWRVQLKFKAKDGSYIEYECTICGLQ